MHHTEVGGHGVMCEFVATTELTLLNSVVFPILYPWLHIHKAVPPLEHKYNCLENIIVRVYQVPHLFTCQLLITYEI